MNDILQNDVRDIPLPECIQIPQMTKENEDKYECIAGNTNFFLRLRTWLLNKGEQDLVDAKGHFGNLNIYFICVQQVKQRKRITNYVNLFLYIKNYNICKKKQF